MTRINTNVSSLIGRNNLNRANQGLSQSLTRLSTGLRINTGKDDPAGLIASENLRSDITAIKRAISNTERANQVIATSDSALGQVSSLLNDIRGLVTESANSGALSDAQVKANQSQVDSSLAALNRIAQTTTFQGRRLLDGSLDFLTTAGTNFSKLSDLAIDQANLGATGSVSVDIEITTAATQAQVDVEDIPVTTTAVAATDDLTITAAAVTEVLSNTTATGGTSISLANSSSGAAVIDVVAVTGQDFAGEAGDITIVFEDTATAGSETTSFDSGTNTLTVGVEAGTSTITQTLAAINAYDEGTTSGADFAATLTSGTTGDAFDAADIGATGVLAGGVDAFAGGDDVITITAAATGEDANDVTVTIAEATGHGTTPTAAIVSGNIVVTVDDSGDTAIADIVSAIDGLDDYTATLSTSDGDGIYSGSETPPTAATLAGGVGGGGITNALVIELSGSDGAEVLSFGANTGIDALVSGINLVSDATGVTATANGTTLELTSSTYGTDSIVDIQVISEGTGTTAAGTFTTSIASGSRSEGTDVVATVNGVSATGEGNQLSINTATLDLITTAEADFTGSIGFDITGGGALFQLGPDVVSNQQARLGIGSVNTARLGGVSGKLFQLGTGGTSELSSDNLDVAAKIIEEAIDEVTSLRGRLGAFQRTTLETNQNALNDTLTNLTAAESNIRDADFAEETANLTRSQILVQSGTRVLAIANQNPQNVLGLLG